MLVLDEQFFFIEGTCVSMSGALKTGVDMAATFSEEQVHQYLYQRGLESLIDDAPELDQTGSGELPGTSMSAHSSSGEEDGEEGKFDLWRIIKYKTLGKLERLHSSIRYGDFIGSKVKLPIDNTRPMELDLLGQHEDGLFILELKVDRSAERNAFSELFAYSNYVAEIFALSGPKDITNVLVANLDVKITRQAFLYDLIISDRNIIVYRPVFSNGTLESLRLQVHVPSDDDFRHFTNQLLSHDTMSCVVTSFHDLDHWFDSKETGGSLLDYTKKHLDRLSGYTAQLMEDEHLHGFCFVRKPWQEISTYYRNSLVICALNPFKITSPEHSNSIVEQIEEQFRGSFLESPELAFDGRLLSIAQRAIKDCLTHDYECKFETPLWSAMVVSGREVVFTHNFGFRPTGIMREAYVSYLNSIYATEAADGFCEDVSILKVNEIANYLRAWQFMEMCGFANNGDNGIDEMEHAQ
ncbi:hypothetical protein [Chromobacterium subtsugae]|uniref:hypothetical protein n=1 Tax=Chromobacterium subtsugae TaxID=251747 RepID=UPI00191BD821|nr:hypothetical protein [Chromobacterium subtsugae]